MWQTHLFATARQPALDPRSAAVPGAAALPEALRRVGVAGLTPVVCGSLYLVADAVRLLRAVPAAASG